MTDYYDLFPDELKEGLSSNNLDAIDSARSICNPHLKRAGDVWQTVLQRHTLLHLMNLDEGEAHDQCMEWMRMADEQLTQARQSLWN